MTLTGSQRTEGEKHLRLCSCKVEIRPCRVRFVGRLPMLLLVGVSIANRSIQILFAEKQRRVALLLRLHRQSLRLENGHSRERLASNPGLLVELQGIDRFPQHEES